MSQPVSWEANRTFWLPSPGCDEIPPAPTYDGPADPCWTAWADEAGIAPLALAMLHHSGVTEPVFADAELEHAIADIRTEGNA